MLDTIKLQNNEWHARIIFTNKAKITVTKTERGDTELQAVQNLLKLIIKEL